MRLLVDANLSPVVSEHLRTRGFDVSHVADHGLAGATDEEITDFATAEASAISVIVRRPV
jgi:predicted nuclease of predicted toxin-antitoxin system